MSEDNKYTINDLISFGVEQKPVEFSDAFNSLIVDKLNAAVDYRRQEVAQSMFAGPEDPDEEDDGWDDDIEDEDFEDDAEEEGQEGEDQ